MTVLIVAPRTDDHAAPVAAELRRRGYRVSFLDVAELPALTRLSVLISPDQDLSAVLERAEDPLDLADVRTVWLRRTTNPAPRVLDAGFATAEVQHLLVGLAQALRDRRWVNPLHALAMDGGWGKVRQLQVARRVGLEVPRTLMTNDPERLREFAAACPGGVVYKPFACPDGLFATDVTERLRDARRLAEVREAPGIFQERVEKRADLRVTVMGERVFATEIDSQSEEVSRVDYRRRCYSLPRRPHSLPDDVAGRLVALHRELGLEFGTCDFAVTPEGRHVFFEVNQSGQFFRVGEAPGLHLLAPFVDFLAGDLLPCRAPPAAVTLSVGGPAPCPTLS